MISDQGKRAAISIPLNIAEGAGKTSKKDAARYYAIARGSSMESGAVLDVCHVLGLVDEECYRKAIHLLARLVGGLTVMCRRV